jgi:phosphoribosyl 1,2-cyclic phosphate phosphodiesterase
MLIDPSPDIFSQALHAHLELSKVKNIIFTHAHEDHMDVFALIMRSRDGATKLPEGKEESNFITIYGNAHVKERLDYEFSQQPHAHRDRIRFMKLDAGKELQVGEYSVLPILANHIKTEECFLFAVSKGNSSFFYGNDTGMLSEESFSLLEGYSRVFDFVSLDISRGTLLGDAHMGWNEVQETVLRMKQMGRINENTKIYLNHYSHVCGLNSREFEEIANSEGMNLSYDGLQLKLVSE